MSTYDKRNPSLLSEPFDGLASPFLEQEFHAEPGEEQWELRLSALELESPFLHMLDFGRPTLIGPTEPEEEFVEEEEWGDVDNFTVEETEAYDEAWAESGEAESWPEIEAPQFEYDLGSASRDFSLKDIADKDNLPDEIRTDILRDGKTDVKDLANRALWSRHTGIAGQQLDITGSKHAKLRAEWGVYARQAKALIWLRQVIDELDKTRGDIPRDFLLGWMAVESDGKVSVVTSRPERGYFQIDWKAGEAQSQLGLSETQFRKLSINRAFSIKQGIELVEKYRQWILNHYPSVPDKSELLWRLTKGRHAASGSLKAVLDRLARRQTNFTWAEISPLIPGFMRRNVNATLGYARKLKPFADLVGAPIPTPTTMPELHGEFALRTGESNEESTYELFEEEHRDLPIRAKVANTFSIPFRWICKISVRKDGKYHHGGTGVLISDRHVLTAAHVVYDVYKNRAQYDLEVTPAQSGHDDLGTYSLSGKPHIPALYKPGESDYDYALVTLNTAIGQKTFREVNNNKLCFWGNPDCGGGTILTRVDPKSLQTQTAYTAGYPKNKGATTMWCFSGLLVSVQEKARTMAYTGEGTEGQSGSPVWVRRDGQYVLVGVLVARGQVNIVVRLTREFVRQLADWIGTKQKEALEEGVDDLESRQESEAEGLWDISQEQDSTSLDTPPEPETQTLEPLEIDEEFIEAWTGKSTEYESQEELYPLTVPRRRTLSRQPRRSTAEPTPNVDQSLFERQSPKGGAIRAVPAWAAAIDPFPPRPSLTFHMNEARMMAAFAPVAAGTSNRLCAALVDLTGNPARPPYAGLNDTEMIYPGSLAKLIPMYAAFALRAQVQAFVDAAFNNGVSILAPGIIAEIERAWRPKLKALFPDRPERGFGSKQDLFPRLGQIFDFSPFGIVDFARVPLTAAHIDRISEDRAPEGKFHDWMRSMLRWSNNVAASRCILALGYFYMNGLLAHSGLFDSASDQGLWLSADYAAHDWVRTSAEQKANAAGQLLAPRWATAQKRRRSNFAATAAQVARFMTLLAQDNLVNAQSSQEMRSLLDVMHGGLGSEANDALDKANRSRTSVAAKFGRGNDNFRHCCAIIERTVGSKSLRYVAVGLGSTPTGYPKDIADLFVQLDDAIIARNP